MFWRGALFSKIILSKYDKFFKKYKLKISGRLSSKLSKKGNCKASLLCSLLNILICIGLTDCPSYGFYMYLYEFILRKTQRKLGQPWSTLLAGGVTGIISKLI